MRLGESCIINVLTHSPSLMLGFGDDADDQPVAIPDLPDHLVQWTRRASKVNIDVPPTICFAN
jgi:hypothetical protein